MSIILSNVSFHYPSQDKLFQSISFTVSPLQKVSLIGDNGVGKSTILRLIMNEISPSSGSIVCSSQPYYLSQHTKLENKTVAEALGVEHKIKALRAILEGNTDQKNFDVLADEWDIESKCHEALKYWGLSGLNLKSSIQTLSGGEQSKVYLSGLVLHQPQIILLDEPSNHLDYSTRIQLYDYIENSKACILVVSHDVQLLDLLDTTYELSAKGICMYGGNFSFYKDQKEKEENALQQQINSETTTLRMSRKKAQEVAEKQDKRNRQGEKNKDQLPRIMRKNVMNRGENTKAKLKEKHSEIIEDAKKHLSELREKQNLICELKINFDNSPVHFGKTLIRACNINFEYKTGQPLWKSPFSCEIQNGDRIHITGDNGNGKTTLVRMLIGELLPTFGEIRRSEFKYIYLDQNYRQVDTAFTVLELAEEYNINNLQDHEIKIRLNRALFPKEMWDKSCKTLSGGEKMRLYLCCLMISNQTPDLIVLDEPSNNLDLSGRNILANTIKDYRGTILLISHDIKFASIIEINQEIKL